MNLLTDMPARLLALLNSGNPNAGGFLDALKGPLLIIAIALGLALIIGMVILTMHRDGGGKRSKRGRSARLAASRPMAPGEEGSRRKKRRHKRRRRDHRKRNPTLSETGGLPPKDSATPEGDDTEPDQ
jgi:hypothetical protein